MRPDVPDVPDVPLAAKSMRDNEIRWDMGCPTGCPRDVPRPTRLDHASRVDTVARRGRWSAPSGRLSGSGAEGTPLRPSRRDVIHVSVIGVHVSVIVRVGSDW